MPNRGRFALIRRRHVHVIVKRSLCQERGRQVRNWVLQSNIVDLVLA